MVEFSSKDKAALTNARTISMLAPARPRPRLRVEEVFDIELNEKQLKHYPAVRTFVGFPSKGIERRDIDAAREWLANANRNEGRTTILGICFLEWAAEHPNQRIDYFDHHTTRSGTESMFRMLRDLSSKHPVFAQNTDFIRHQSAFTFKDPYGPR